MASASNSTENFALDEEVVHSAIRDVLQQILASHNHHHDQIANLQSNSEMRAIITKIHDMLIKLDQISIKLREFLNVSLIPSLVEKYFYSSQVDPNEILNEIESLRTTLESFLPKLSNLQTASNNTFALLVQMSLEGIEIPSLEDFISAQTEFSPTNLLFSSMANPQEANTTNRNLVNELIIWLVQTLGRRSAWCRHFEGPLVTVGCLVTQLHISMFEEYKKLIEERKDAYDKIASLKLRLDESQLRLYLSRIEGYISQATDNTPSFEMRLSSKIWESYLLVKESISSCRMQYPDASVIEVIKKLTELPHCAGLVHPIVSLLGCSVENGWRIILDIFSQIPSTS